MRGVYSYAGVAAHATAVGAAAVAGDALSHTRDEGLCAPAAAAARAVTYTTTHARYSTPHRKGRHTTLRYCTAMDRTSGEQRLGTEPETYWR